MEKFKQLGISESILKVIKEQGFEKPSEIQEKTIPLVLKKKDIIAGASTGSGKTLSFGVGIIEHSNPDFGIQGLVLTPTRELAEQITRELRKFSKHKTLNITPVYGGTPIQKQIKGLESAEIVVGTPGRILDHLSRRTLDLQFVKTLVLDEADRMFDMGFKDDVEKIISQCPKERQTLLYSATITQELILLAKKHMKKGIEISAEPHVDPAKLSQIYYDIEDGLKFSLLKHLLENEKAKLVMVFCNTRHNVDFVANNLKLTGVEALPIHGGFSQEKRNRIMEKFHSKTVHVLICTDVAARGLDISGISHVYNYDIPREHKEYVHRIGRTARAGKEGKVINILTSRGYEDFSSILKHNPKFKISKVKTPFVKKVIVKWMGDKRGRRRDSGGRRDFGGRKDSGLRRRPEGKRDYRERESRSWSRSSGIRSNRRPENRKPYRKTRTRGDEKNPGRRRRDYSNRKRDNRGFGRRNDKRNDGKFSAGRKFDNRSSSSRRTSRR